MRKSKTTPGIEARKCRSGEVSYLASVFDSRTGKRVRKTFPTVSAAKRWRVDTQAAIRAGKLAPASALTIGAAADELLAGMELGTIRGRSGKPYKPSVLRSYRRAIDKRVRPTLGTHRVSELRRRDVQAFVDSMAADGLSASTIRNALDPLRVIVRRAITREIITENPTTHIEVPVADGKRDRIASASEAAKLIDALSFEDRALWGTAMYAGLRRGELRALRWGDLDLASGVIRVERGWDDVEGEIDGKSDAARRTVPVAGPLRDLLVEHRMLRGERPADALVFGRTDELPFTASTIGRRAATAWAKANRAETEAAEREHREPEQLAAITLHECRHTFASIGIAAGLNVKALSTFMGHSTIGLTLDLYGHLMPGNEAEAASLLDGYLLRSSGSPSGSPTATRADRSEPQRIGGEAPIPVAMRETA